MIDMDGIRIGDRFVPLPNSRTHGPKEWTLSVDSNGKRTWTEIPMSESKKEVARLKATIWWANHPTWERTTPVTQADLDKYNLPDSYLDGFAVFPSPMYYPPGRNPASKAARVAAEDLWMAHYAEMEANQTIIRPPEKPEENILEAIGKAKIALERGD